MKKYNVVLANGCQFIAYGLAIRFEFRNLIYFMKILSFQTIFSDPEGLFGFDTGPMKVRLNLNFLFLLAVQSFPVHADW